MNHILETVAAAAKESLSNIGVHIRDSALVGSLYIRGTLQENSDVDFLVLVPCATDVDSIFLKEEGWDHGGSSPRATRRGFQGLEASPIADLIDASWGSWTKHLGVPEIHDGQRVVKANLLITSDPEYFERWVVSAKVCKFLHDSGVQLTRGQVHGVHEVIMDDAEPESQVELRRY